MGTNGFPTSGLQDQGRRPRLRLIVCRPHDQVVRGVMWMSRCWHQACPA